MKKFNIIEKTLIATGVFGIVVIGIVLIVTQDKSHEVESLILGIIATILLNFINYRFLTKTALENPEKLRRNSLISYVARYSMFILLLVLAIFLPFLNPIYVSVGLLTYYIMLLLMSILFRNQKDGDI